MTSTPWGVSESATGVAIISGAQALGRDEVSREALATRGVRALVHWADVGVGVADTVCAGMESVLVGFIVVDEFDDVDL